MPWNNDCAHTGCPFAVFLGSPLIRRFDCLESIVAQPRSKLALDAGGDVDGCFLPRLAYDLSSRQKRTRIVFWMAKVE